MARLRQREHERFGERILPGGDMYEQSQAFLGWAASYDEGGLDIRSRQRHDQWLGMLPCPILCFEGEYSIEEQLAVLMVEREERFSLHITASWRYPEVRVSATPQTSTPIACACCTWAGIITVHINDHSSTHAAFVCASTRLPRVRSKVVTSARPTVP